jgi:hypothetical protein
MKQLLFSSALAFTSFFSVSAQVDPNAPQPGQMPQVAPAASQQNPEFVQFKEIVYDFGNIKQSIPATHTFTFKNVGTRDITLVNVAASCGCTTPNWKGGAYKPGETGEITATYNAAGEGGFEKTVTVTTSEGIVLLTIKGNVMNVAAYDAWKAAEDAAAAAKAKADGTKKPAKKTSSKSKAKTKTNSEATKPKSAAKGS